MPIANSPTHTPQAATQCLAVDASCPGNPGPMEYRGVHLPSGKVVFRFGPMQGTNNIGEFLAIVHALALLKKHGVSMPVYTDSKTALAWLRKQKCGTKMAQTAENADLFAIVARAEAWLHHNDYSDCPVRKWDTTTWGEIPADFGRK